MATAASSAGSGSRPGPVSGPVSRPESRVDDHARPALAACRRWPGSPGAATSRCASPERRRRAAGGQQRGGEQVVGPPGGRPGQQIGGGRRDEHQIGLLSEPDVRHLVGVVEHRVCTGLPDRAAQVAAPTNSQRGLRSGRRSPRGPSARSRRSSSQALYAAMPPATPRMTRLMVRRLDGSVRDPRSGRVVVRRRLGVRLVGLSSGSRRCRRGRRR